MLQQIKQAIVGQSLNCSSTKAKRPTATGITAADNVWGRAANSHAISEFVFILIGVFVFISAKIQNQ